MEQDTTKRSVGVVIVLAFLLALASIATMFWLDRRSTAEREAARAIDARLDAAQLAAADLRGAQMGYLAAGQSPDFWMRRAGELASQIESALADAGASSRSGDARSHETAASTALASLMSIDKRAREQVAGDQRLLAADTLFSDSGDESQRLATELSAARTSEASAAGVLETRGAAFRLAAAGVASLGFIGLVFLGARSGRIQTVASSAAQTAQMLRELPPPVKAPAAAVRTVSAVSALSVNLSDAAELCVDLARVMDGRDIPTLLERAAGVLGARGLILWMVDGNGQVLRPSLTHGYSDRVMTRLDTLEVAAENVTSLSFRTMKPQTMNGAGIGAPGAVAVPLVTASGCTGVLSAETKESKPAAEAIAVARMLAAQFAVLISPAAEAASTHAAEA